MAFQFVDKLRQTGNTVTTFNMTLDVGTGADRLLTVELLQRGAALVAVSSMTYNGVALTRAAYGQNDVPATKLRADIWYLANPSSGSNTLTVNYASTVSQYECQASWYVGADDVTVVDDTDGTSGQSTTPAVSLTPTENDQLLVGCAIHEDANAMTTGSGETTIYNFDNGAWVTSSSYDIQTTAETQSVDWTAGTSDYWAAAGASFFVAADANTSPTVALNTADLSELGTTPTLEFTGTDAEDDEVTYQIQISDRDDFGGDGILLADNNPGNGGGGVVHPNPHASATAWTGYIQADDRPGQSFVAQGGILDEIQVYFGPDTDTDGYAQIRVYEHTGTFGTSSAPLNYVPYDETPTPDWIAQSARVYCDTSIVDGWKVFEFTGADRIRLEADTYYVFILDWQSNDRIYDNTIATVHDSVTPIHPGNVYMDGYSATNCRPWPTLDMWFKVYEEFVLIDELSTGTGDFENTVTPADTDPFNSAEKIAFTVDTLDELTDGVTYFWRVRAKDPDGTNLWGDWSATRSFDVADAAAVEESITIAITQSCTQPREAPSVEESVSIGVELSAVATENTELLDEISLATEITAVSDPQATLAASISISRESGVSGAGAAELAATTTISRTLASNFANQILVESMGTIAKYNTAMALDSIWAAGQINIAKYLSISNFGGIIGVGNITIAVVKTTTIAVDLPGAEESISLQITHQQANQLEAILAESLHLTKQAEVDLGSAGILGNTTQIARWLAAQFLSETSGDFEEVVSIAKTAAMSSSSGASLVAGIELAKALDISSISGAEVFSAALIDKLVGLLASVATGAVEESIVLDLALQLQTSTGAELFSAISVGRRLDSLAAEQLSAEIGVLLQAIQGVASATQLSAADTATISRALQLPVTTNVTVGDWLILAEDLAVLGLDELKLPTVKARLQIDVRAKNSIVSDLTAVSEVASSVSGATVETWEE